MRFMFLGSLLFLSLSGCSNFGSSAKKNTQQETPVETNEKQPDSAEYVTEEFLDYRFEMPAEMAQTGHYHSNKEKSYFVSVKDPEESTLKESLIVFSRETCGSPSQLLDVIKANRAKARAHNEQDDLVSGGPLAAKSAFWEKHVHYGAIVFEKNSGDGTCLLVTVNSWGIGTWAQSHGLVDLLQRVVDTISRK